MPPWPSITRRDGQWRNMPHTCYIYAQPLWPILWCRPIHGQLSFLLYSPLLGIYRLPPPLVCSLLSKATNLHLFSILSSATALEPTLSTPHNLYILYAFLSILTTSAPITQALISPPAAPANQLYHLTNAEGMAPNECNYQSTYLVSTDFAYQYTKLWMLRWILACMNSTCVLI